MRKTKPAVAQRCDDSAFQEALNELASLHSSILNSSDSATSRLSGIHKTHRDSALNFLHYLAFRSHDLRPLQAKLAALGLSSLGRAESHVLATVTAVLNILHRLTKSPAKEPSKKASPLSFSKGQTLLEHHAEALLGPSHPQRDTRIMVTMPSEAAQDYSLIHNLLQEGMECMRINCAHDDSKAWQAMIKHLRRAEKSLGKSCKIIMDLGGPKLRTGPLEPTRAVIQIHPHRDAYGKVKTPARIWLNAEGSGEAPPSHANAIIPVPDNWLHSLKPGAHVKFVDARNARRTLKIVDVTNHGAWAECNRTAYVVPGTVLHHEPGEGKKKKHHVTIGELPVGESAIFLNKDDVLIVTRDQQPGRPATCDSSGKVLTPAKIGCTLPEVFEDVKSGETIWFDDGKIGGLIERVEPTEVFVRITQVRLKGGKLKSDKGINLPMSQLRLAAMTPKDVDDLPFIARNADIVALSFANTALDVELLQERLKQIGGKSPAIVLKIETQRAFANLPEMLLTALRGEVCGIMIARGDLAVECGFERLAEVQEEILWICEAAHVPVIWATQVLESLAKDGLPSRAEVTDAAMGQRAECVMLNKGPQIVNAVRALDSILQRMQGHQDKKRSMLRRLRLGQLTTD